MARLLGNVNAVGRSRIGRPLVNKWLGLAIVRDLAEKWGGTVIVGPADGGGTRIEVRLNAAT
jgi:signal transduction histidine kinase